MKKTYKLNLIFIVLMTAAFLLPRLLRDPAGGFAAATSSALFFFGLFLTAGFLACYQFLYTFRRRNILSKREVIFGISPLILSIVVCLLLIFFLRYQ
ncbi:MAG: hypothetical protein AB8G77_23455 [Rhodothermales bacterium]